MDKKAKLFEKLQNNFRHIKPDLQDMQVLKSRVDFNNIDEISKFKDVYKVFPSKAEALKHNWDTLI